MPEGVTRSLCCSPSPISQYPSVWKDKCLNHVWPEPICVMNCTLHLLSSHLIASVLVETSWWWVTCLNIPTCSLSLALCDLLELNHTWNLFLFWLISLSLPPPPLNSPSHHPPDPVVGCCGPMCREKRVRPVYWPPPFPPPSSFLSFFPL